MRWILKKASDFGVLFLIAYFFIGGVKAAETSSSSASKDEIEKGKRQIKAIEETLSKERQKLRGVKKEERRVLSELDRIERGIGWVLFSVGSILLLSYGAFKLIEEMVRNPDVALALKIGTLALIFGLVVLLVSVLRERLAVRKVDKYSREVQK